MNEKMNVAMFNEYKEKMLNLISTTEKYLESHKDDLDFNQEQYEKELSSQYIALQNKLLEQDLSAIPFESWEGLPIISPDDNIVDFSKSKANIDFNILNFWGKGNFKNCTIRNLDSYLSKGYEGIFDNQLQQSLSTNFDTTFTNKFFTNTLTMDDLIPLNDIQIKELLKENIQQHLLNYDYTTPILNILGIKKMLELYKYSKEDFEFVKNYLEKPKTSNQDFNNKISQAAISEIKKLCYENERKEILANTNLEIKPTNYSQEFIDLNSDIFLIDSKISQELRNKYYKRSLSTSDIIENLDVFSNIPIENFMAPSSVRDFSQKLGPGGLQYVLKNHRDVFDYLYNANHFPQVTNNLKANGNLEERFLNAIKTYLYNTYDISKLETYNTENGIKKYKLPDWLASLNFEFIEKFTTIEDLKKYNNKTILIDQYQRKVLETFNIEQLIQFDNSTQFFSHKAKDNAKELENMAMLGYFLSKSNFASDINIPSKDNISYSQFTSLMAKCLDSMRKHNIFTDNSNYDFIVGEFREKYPEIFMPQTAPTELKTAFYRNMIDGDFLKQHQEYIPYLIDKNLKNVINGMFEINCYNSRNDSQNNSYNQINFIDYYTKLYGNEKFLNLIAIYGNLGTDLSNGIFDLSTDIEKQYRDIVYKNIIKNPGISFKHLLNTKDFVKEHQDIFLLPEELSSVPASIRDNFIKDFYEGNLEFEQLRNHVELITILKTKNLNCAFASYNKDSNRPTEVAMINILGQDKFLELCSRYGRYLENTYTDLALTIKDGKYFAKEDAKELTFEELCKKIEETIAKQCKNGKKAYYYHDAPAFLQAQMPSLFLDPQAPKELQDLFYYSKNTGLTFSLIAEHKEWLPYLEGKSLATALLRTKEYDYKYYFDLFGVEKGIKLGLQRAQTVDKMLLSRKVNLMKEWYDKTGQKFIPDVVVMENFALSNADKFLTAGSNWSTLMKITNFSQHYESRDTMLKLAYCFGAFDQDQIGMKKLQELLTGIPRTYNSQEISSLKTLEKNILASKNTSANNKETKAYEHLKEALKNAGFQFTSPNIFDDIFNIHQDMSATLKLNPQTYPQAMKHLRTILEQQNIVLNAYQAHELFGEFSLNYNKDFREFLLKNLDEIRTWPRYATSISSIQKQFASIKALNSNRPITLDLALSFIQANNYLDINVGNDKVAEISAIAGYSQEDFNTLQQIYNYGKTRTFNSIPKIENKKENYSYEILRLDDPLAMSVGTLTCCCQKLHGAAELCMEHSMVDKNGRILVVKDQENNIIAQSWVWRNKDVLCFDSIEIPLRSFVKARKTNPELDRNGLATEIIKIYKQIAHDLIKADEITYKELLESGKITQEQYDGLRLGKITVGHGNSHMVNALKNNLTKDDSISAPLPYQLPVNLNMKTKYTDSRTQYILEERENRQNYAGATLPIYTDSVIEYTNKTFDEKMLLMLEKLELVTKHNPKNMDTQLEKNVAKENIVSSLGMKYNLNPATTRIIMNPNFAIIYDVNANVIKIGDLFYNFKVDNKEQQLDITEEVLIQMKIALNQISRDKVIDTSKLNQEQLEIYNKLASLNEEIDNRKGVSHGR